VPKVVDEQGRVYDIPVSILERSAKSAPSIPEIHIHIHIHLDSGSVSVGSGPHSGHYADYSPARSMRFGYRDYSDFSGYRDYPFASYRDYAFRSGYKDYAFAAGYRADYRAEK
jgi:hypothetical protein